MFDSESKSKSNRTSQFGLYRYRSPEAEVSEDNKTKNSKIRRRLVFASVSMAAIFLLVVCLMVYNTSCDAILVNQNDTFLSSYEEYANESLPGTETFEDILQDDFIPRNLQLDNETAITNADLVKSITHNANTTNNTETIQEPERLIRNPKPYFIPPASPFDNNRRRIDVTNYFTPRPFFFEQTGPVPSAFQKNNLTRLRETKPRNTKNVQDIMSHLLSFGTEPALASANKRNSRIKFSGVYHHPKITKNSRRQNRNQKQTRVPSHNIYNNAKDYTTFDAHGSHIDPFYTFKPVSPSDVNLLAVNKFRFAPHYLENQQKLLQQNMNNYANPLKSPEYYNLNSGILSPQYFSDRDKVIPVMEPDENEEEAVKKKTRPFSLMLDIYPIVDDDDEKPSETVNKPKKKRPQNGGQLINPHMQYPQYYYPQQMPNNQYYQYFHNLHQPQLQNQYQNEYYNNYYRNRYFQKNEFLNYGNPHYVNKKDSRKKVLNHLTNVANTLEGNKPSQMIVHLNVYPKKKSASKRTKHRSIEILNRNSDISDEDEVRIGEVSGDKEGDCNNDAVHEARDEENRGSEEKVLDNDNEFENTTSDIAKDITGNSSDEDVTEEATTMATTEGESGEENYGISKSEIPVLVLTEDEFESFKNNTNLKNHKLVYTELKNENYDSH